MPRVANNGVFLVLTGFSSFRGLIERPERIGHDHEFYQLLAQAAQKNRGLGEFGDRLLALAEHAYAFRRVDDLAELSRLLIRLPLPRKYEQVGYYYHALSIKRSGKGDLEQSARLLEQVAENAPASYRVRAVQSLGGSAFCKKEYGLALSFYAEAARIASRERICDPVAVVVGQWDVAVIRSLAGDHRQALSLLENVLPLAKMIWASQPRVYYGYLNSLAGELGEAGRLDEAEVVSRITLRSPLANAYPEFYETKKELELRRGLRASRSHISVGQPFPAAESLVSNNVVPLHSSRYVPGMTASSFPPLLPRQEARVLRFKCRNEPMAKQSRNTNIAEQIRQMSHAERVIRLLELISSNDTTTEELAKILEIAESVAGKGKRQG